MSTGSSSQTTTTNNPIATAAMPYVQQALGGAGALLNKPYEAYQGQQVAQFTPLQQQSFEGAQTMAPSQLSGVAGLSALGAGQNYMNMATNPGATQAFMSPYQQGVIDVAQRNAMRNADIAGQARNAAAVKAGAFGGSRQAIENAEANRNLQQQLSDIQTQGLQSAYDKAQQNMQYGSNLGLQGAQAAGTLGGQLFQQGMDINKLQNTYGTQQQANVQSVLDKAYQQYQEQQQYPYKNLAFLSDMYRGLPLSSGTQTTSGTSSPSLLTQIGGLGALAYGLNKKEGGVIKSPAKTKKNAGVLGKLAAYQIGGTK